MSAHPILADPEDTPGQQAADAQFYREALHDLISVGTSLARHLHQQVTTQPQPTQQALDAPPAPAPAPQAAPAPEAAAIAFDRISRAVRRCVALARSLTQPPPPASNPAQHCTAIHKHATREAGDAIHHTDGGIEHADDESLSAGLHDHLDAPELDDDLSDRPINEIIAAICRDLGLANLPGGHAWRPTRDDIAQLCARAVALNPAHRPGAGPHDPSSEAAQPSPASPSPTSPAPASPAPSGHTPPNAAPAAILRTGPALLQPGSRLPNDPPEAVAAVLRYARHRGRW